MLTMVKYTESILTVYTFLHIKIAQKKEKQRKRKKRKQPYSITELVLCIRVPSDETELKYSSWINGSMPWDYELILAKKEGLKNLMFIVNCTWLLWV